MRGERPRLARPHGERRLRAVGRDGHLDVSDGFDHRVDLLVDRVRLGRDRGKRGRGRCRVSSGQQPEHHGDHQDCAREQDQQQLVVADARGGHRPLDPAELRGRGRGGGASAWRAYAADDLVGGEAQVLGVRAQRPADVDVAEQRLEVLGLERAELVDMEFGVAAGRVERDAPPLPRFPQGGTHPDHRVLHRASGRGSRAVAYRPGLGMIAPRLARLAP